MGILVVVIAGWLLFGQPDNDEAAARERDRLNEGDPLGGQERDFFDALKPSTAGAVQDVAGFGGPDAPQSGFNSAHMAERLPIEEWDIDEGFGSLSFDNFTEASGGDVPGHKQGGGGTTAADLDTQEGRDSLTDQEFKFLFGANTPRF